MSNSIITTWLLGYITGSKLSNFLFSMPTLRTKWNHVVESANLTGYPILNSESPQPLFNPNKQYYEVEIAHERWIITEELFKLFS